MLLAFDMDGTIADLYGYPDWLGYLRAMDATPYRYCAPLGDVDALRDAMRSVIRAGHEVYILSWNCGGDWPDRDYRYRVMAAKRAWLQQYRIPYTRLRVVGNGTPKAAVAPHRGILFDDEERNRAQWEASGKGRAYAPERMLDVLARVARERG